jgi:anti-sigma B factor antagonist
VADPAQSPQDAPSLCPACGEPFVPDPSSPEEEGPCPYCRRPVWFVRKPLNEAIVLTFLTGLVSGSESLGRLDEVTSAVGNASRIVVDLSRMRFISSMFLGMLVALHRRVVAAQGALRLCGLRSGEQEVFRATRLDTVFDIREDEASALASF